MIDLVVLISTWAIGGTKLASVQPIPLYVDYVNRTTSYHGDNGTIPIETYKDSIEVVIIGETSIKWVFLSELMLVVVIQLLNVFAIHRYTEDVFKFGADYNGLVRDVIVNVAFNIILWLALGFNELNVIAFSCIVIAFIWALGHISSIITHKYRLVVGIINNIDMMPIASIKLPKPPQVVTSEIKRDDNTQQQQQSIEESTLSSSSSPSIPASVVDIASDNEIDNENENENTNLTSTSFSRDVNDMKFDHIGTIMRNWVGFCLFIYNIFMISTILTTSGRAGEMGYAIGPVIVIMLLNSVDYLLIDTIVKNSNKVCCICLDAMDINWLRYILLITRHVIIAAAII